VNHPVSSAPADALYCVQVAYPVAAGFFDIGHYVNKHVPLALRLMREHLGIVPLRVEILADVAALPGREDPKYPCMCLMYFRTGEEVETFSRFYRTPEISAIMRVDHPNYTKHPPEVQVSRVFDVAAT
jgi:uncharacterized protein (TIGR02118 family)